MRKSHLGRVLTLIVAVSLVFTGCVSPPDWAFFDVEHHPFGAYPARVGYYLGTYVIFPLICLASLLSETGPPTRESDVYAIGVLFGLLVGAPFHLIALPFGSEEDYEPPEGYEELLLEEFQNG